LSHPSEKEKKPTRIIIPLLGVKIKICEATNSSERHATAMENGQTSTWFQVGPENTAPKHPLK